MDCCGLHCSTPLRHLPTNHIPRRGVDLIHNGILVADQEPGKTLICPTHTHQEITTKSRDAMELMLRRLQHWTLCLEEPPGQPQAQIMTPIPLPDRSPDQKRLLLPFDKSRADFALESIVGRQDASGRHPTMLTP
jgi:hypothetical protein